MPTFRFDNWYPVEGKLPYPDRIPSLIFGKSRDTTSGLREVNNWWCRVSKKRTNKRNTLSLIQVNWQLYLFSFPFKVEVENQRKLGFRPHKMTGWNRCMYFRSHQYNS